MSGMSRPDAGSRSPAASGSARRRPTARTFPRAIKVRNLMTSLTFRKFPPEKVAV